MYMSIKFFVPLKFINFMIYCYRTLWINSRKSYLSMAMNSPIAGSFANGTADGIQELHLYNSLTRTKDVFKPVNGNEVKFYICGPTVYDAAHMGHARAYLSFDILRRVLSKYFNYNVLYVMNLDDAIKNIKSQLEHSNGSIKDVETEKCESLLVNSRDILSDWLDSTRGHSVNELSVFSKLAKRFEDDFLDDMRTLNVLEPDVLTRVSEYIPEIIQYVEKIIQNGYAYETNNGSVYFDTNAFNSKPNHRYAKLMPESFGDSESAAKHLKESEGELSIGDDKLQEKKSLADFALWKCSKSGEPFWDSPWGKGRPGWHIECSAMSSAILGDRLDIHAGGFDLKFPHHDNEIAQCEAYYDTDVWTNYFLHCGALKIAGSKMSKSLKNFISIKQVLKQYNARQLRILFLMHTWTDPLDYTTESMQRVLQFEKLCSDFFLAVKDFYRRQLAENKNDIYKKYESAEMELLNEFCRGKEAIHEALCDSVDTRTVVEKMREIIKHSNIYIMEKTLPNSKLLRVISDYLLGLLKIFGAVSETANDFSFCGSESHISSQIREEQIMPVLDALASFRFQVRNSAKEYKNIDILNACDILRDDTLPELGVCLEDQAIGTCVKLVDREILLKEREERRKAIEDKAAEKIRKQKVLEEQKLLKQQKQKLKAEKEAATLAKKALQKSTTEAEKAS